MGHFALISDGARRVGTTDFQFDINWFREGSLLGAFAKQHDDYDHDVFNSAGSTLATPHFGPENGVHLRERTVYQLAREGRIGGIAKVGNQWRFEKGALLEWMKEGGEVDVIATVGASSGRKNATRSGQQ